MKKVVALSALACTVAVVFTVTATSLDLAETRLSQAGWDDKPLTRGPQERLMYFSPPQAAVVEPYTLILGTLALHAAMNQLHQAPQSQRASPPRRRPATP